MAPVVEFADRRTVCFDRNQLLHHSIQHTRGLTSFSGFLQTQRRQVDTYSDITWLMEPVGNSTESNIQTFIQLLLSRPQVPSAFSELRKQWHFDRPQVLKVAGIGYGDRWFNSEPKQKSRERFEIEH
ncbi:hypothetical protein PM082_013327 [Marasmius tenuissimus]|nr:hypothetical protein PM082_013327 [Marasmius tenuissimus]